MAPRPIISLPDPRLRQKSEPVARVDELLADAGGLEPVGLLGIEPLVPGVELGEQDEVALQGSEQLFARAGVAAAQKVSTARTPLGEASR